ncbi:PilZ domain-containing protein [Thermodesulfobacteriota bacterium]
MSDEKERAARFDSLNLLHYACFDEEGQQVCQGMGRTLNVSETGILLETYAPVEDESPVTVSIGLEDDLVELKGKIMYCREVEQGKYKAGIHFTEPLEKEMQILRQYIGFFASQTGRE